MSEIESIGELIGAQGPWVAGGATALYVGKKLFGPSLDKAGEWLAQVGEKQAINLWNTLTKVPESEAVWVPHLRTAIKVLNDASLYDDDLMQTYVAGMITGSRNADGSDDRPVYYLTVMDGLSAAQLRCFHVLYSAAAWLGAQAPEGHFKFISISVEELRANLRLLQPEGSPESDYMPAIITLEAEGLIHAVAVTDDEGDEWRVSFKPTLLGVLLFDWAHGFSDENIFAFPRDSYPNNGLPKLSFREPSADQSVR